MDKKEKILKLEKERILKAVSDVLEMLSKEFLQNPMRFFSEKDFHWYFCHLLLSREKSFNKLIQTNFENYKTSPLHQEYGLTSKKGQRIDIAILNPKGIKDIDKYNLMSGNNYIKPFIGIEFLTEKNYGGKKAWAEPWNKIGKVHEKLRKNEIEHPYMVFYYRKIEKRKQSINNVTKIKNKIKELHKGDNECGVRIIGVIRDIYGNHYAKFENGEWIGGDVQGVGEGREG